MKITSFLASAAIMLGVVAQSSPVSAVTAPPNPGDFIVNIQPGAPEQGAMPDCDPALTSIGQLFMSGQTTVTTTCQVKSNTTTETITGSASNPTLAASTGDAGFNSGTITSSCQTANTVNLSLEITMTSQQMKSFSGTVFNACSFVMKFADAASSSLSGTIEVNGKLGSEDGSVVNNVVQIVINAKVFVTAGTGAFAGYSGSGDFTQTQEINVDPSQRSGGGSGGTVEQPQAVKDFCTTAGITTCTGTGVAQWCEANRTNPAAAACATIMPQVKMASVRAAAARATASDDVPVMKLTLVKSAGRARILSPAPAAGSPKASATVKSTTKVRVAAPAGSVCTVKANTGKIVGSGKVAGSFAQVNIKPKAGSYKKATSITATCKTPKKKTLTSNKVKIVLR